MIPFSVSLSDKPPKIWTFLSSNLKSQSRSLFINNAIQNGIPWRSYTNFYKLIDTKREIDKIKSQIENKNIKYPEYYLQPFHGYDQGNMNWLAANEAEAATISISSGYWPDISPHIAASWLRNNITNYTNYYHNKYSNKFYTNKNKNQTILDVGCSVGISTEYLKNIYPEKKIFGVDLSPYFISTAKFRSNFNKLDINYIHANAESIPFENNTFDLIFCSFLFHEVPTQPTRNILYEIYRILKPEGIIIITDLDAKKLKERLSVSQFHLWAFEVNEPHIYEYYNQNMKHELLNTGFTYIEKYNINPLNSVWLGKKEEYNYVKPTTIDLIIPLPNNSKVIKKINYSLYKTL